MHNIQNIKNNHKKVYREEFLSNNFWKFQFYPVLLHKIKNDFIAKIIKKMKILVDIRDIEAPFGMKVLQSLSFVKKVKPMTNASIELWEELRDAAQDVQLHKKGKLNLKTAQDLLNEL